ncbi:MAG TPA: hypothetical protein VM712_07645 [Gaiellales bacterium]|jgi:hypothetical protein|nr:hypothetical protein [Gaiellales bacterium]
MRDVDPAQTRELRSWAEALSGSTEPEKRSMGRALVMLLDRIEELERDIAARPGSAPEPVAAEPEPAPDLAASVEDTQPIGLRDRLRAQAARLHHDDSAER